MQTAVFRSSSALDGAPGHAERSGERVEILHLLSDVDVEVGPMFRVQFSDGTQADAFDDELEVGK